MNTALRIAVVLSTACHAGSSSMPDAPLVDDAAQDAVPDSSAVQTSVHGTGFDAYESETLHAVVWDGTTSTNLGTGMTTVASGEFLFGWSFAVDATHYVFAYWYADENGDGACQVSEHAWSVILYNPVQNVTPGTAAAADCSHF